MTTTFQTNLEAAKMANATYTKKNGQLQARRDDIASERDKFHMAAVESAKTKEEIRMTMKLCPSVHSPVRKAALGKLLSMAKSIDDLLEIRKLNRRGYLLGSGQLDEMRVKWSDLSMLEVNKASNRNELWLAYQRAVGEACEVAVMLLIKPYRDCTSLEDLEKLEKQYGKSDIMYGPYYDAYERLYKERYGVMPTYPSVLG
jgi:hypothetical protein